MRIAEEWSSKGRKLRDKIRLTGLLRTLICGPLVDGDRAALCATALYPADL
jgi:hypothetical protein